MKKRIKKLRKNQRKKLTTKKRDKKTKEIINGYNKNKSNIKGKKAQKNERKIKGNQTLKNYQ